MVEPETIERIHAGRSARAASATALSAATQAMTDLRKDFKLHLLRADVVRDVFGCDGERVDTRC